MFKATWQWARDLTWNQFWLVHPSICCTDTLILNLSVTSKRNCFFIPLTIAAFGQSRPADSLVPIHKHTEWTTSAYSLFLSPRTHIHLRIWDVYTVPLLRWQVNFILFMDAGWPSLTHNGKHVILQMLVKSSNVSLFSDGRCCLCPRMNNVSFTFV